MYYVQKKKYREKMYLDYKYICIYVILKVHTFWIL